MKKDYILGLDLGTNSIGWACINEDTQNIEDAGVRIFDRAEIPKTGESLAKPRREARLSRRRLHHRRVRLNSILQLLKSYGFIIEKSQLQSPYKGNIWELRVRALSQKLSYDELARVIYHITKNRGFKSSKKETDNLENKELTKANADMQNVVDAFTNSGYRTIAEYMLNTYEDTNIRNKFGSYSQLIKQDLNEKELMLILDTQKNTFHNILINDTFEQELLDIFLYRKGLPSFEEKVGDCNLEPKYKRAPKDSITACLFRAWSDLNNIRYRESEDTELKALSLDQRKELIQLAFDKANENKKPTETQIISIMKAGKIEKNEKDKKTSEYLMNYDIKKIIKSLIFSSYSKLKNICEELKIWEQIKNNNEQIDAVIYCIAYLKELKNLKKLKDPIIKDIISNLHWTDKVWEELFDSLSFDGTMGHSLQAIWQLLPCFQLMQEGKPYTYDKCIEQIYPNSFNNRESQNKNFVPKFNEHDITNPVVKRTLNQTRLLINKLIVTYGKPSQINIELARDLGKSHADRKELEKQMKQNQENNAKYWEQCQELGIKDPIMYRLWREQSCICLYTGGKISSDDLKGNNVEIDHILPISRSGDDSLMNKVLVFSSENQHKGNRTAFEYLSSKGENQLESYKTRIKNSHLRHKKKERLLLENFDENKSQEYKTRHLNDSRYIARLLTQHLDKTIRPKDRKSYVKTIPGQATSVLRKLWNFKDKVREESHKHHAFDAILIAGAGSKIKSWEKGITNILKYRYQEDKGLSLGEKAKRNIARFGLHIEQPWESFADDARVFMEKVFVSRMGKRKITGEIHAQTINSKQYTDAGERIVKTLHLQSLGKKEDEVLKQLNKMVDIIIHSNGEITGRNAPIYHIIKNHAESFNWNMDEAFNIDNAPTMPVKKSNPVHIPKIRKIKIESSASSKIHSFKSMSSDRRQSAVDSGDVIRLDLFRDSKGKFFVIPVYPFHYKEIPEPTDKNSEFIFSIYKNDYLYTSADIPFIINGNSYNQIEGYWNTNMTDSQIVAMPHENNQKFVIKISKMNKIEKYHIDILGRKHFVTSSDIPQEERPQRLSLKEQQELWDKNKYKD